MPLSKCRMRARKRQDRFDKQLVVEDVKPNIPLYNPAVHRAGDRVLVVRGSRKVEVVIPKLDAEGQPIPEF